MLNESRTPGRLTPPRVGHHAQIQGDWEVHLSWSNPMSNEDRSSVIFLSHVEHGRSGGLL